MNPADVPSHQADYAQKFHGETLLPTLQQKIHHGVQEGWQLNTNFTCYVKLLQVHDTTHITSPHTAPADATDPPLKLFTASTSLPHVCI